MLENTGESKRKLTSIIYCQKCKTWMRIPVEIPQTPQPFKLRVACPSCGDVIHASDVNPSEAPKAGSQELARSYCTNPKCGRLIELHISKGEFIAVPCPDCLQTVYLGAPPAESNAILPGAEVDIAEQEFGCAACGKHWVQCFPATPGKTYLVRCPNPTCPKPASMNYTI